MLTYRKAWCVVLGAAAMSLCSTGFAPAPENGQGQEASTGGRRIGAADLARLLDEARNELQVAHLSEKEIRLRLKIVENVATVKAYFPHVIGGPPETRNSKYWRENDDGCYVPRGRATEAIKDLWRTTSGIRCRKLSTLVMLKGLIDVADAKQLSQLDEKLRGKVIPNDLPNQGIGTLFEKPHPKKGGIFQADEFLPGDEVWFHNPYFGRLSQKRQGRYRGQEGHHVFYVGGGKVMDMYSREPVSIEDFRETFLRWGSVKIAAKAEDREPEAAEFQIKAVRRVIVEPK
jgi:hypothetical protein